MRYRIGVLCLLLGLASPAVAQIGVDVDVALPGVNIGIDIPAYPDLQPVPDYPVYYAPGLSANFFFYDGMYWVFAGDSWYSCAWYNGPWIAVQPEVVPLFILRVPVTFYVQPPAFFVGWAPNAAPRWGDHWGPTWQQQHAGWDQWNHGSVPARAPLPTYQRQYSGSKYPAPAEQRTLLVQNYHYQPHDAEVREQFQKQVAQKSPSRPSAPAPAERSVKAPEAVRPPTPAPAERSVKAPEAVRPPTPAPAERSVKATEAVRPPAPVPTERPEKAPEAVRPPAPAHAPVQPEPRAKPPAPVEPSGKPPSPQAHETHPEAHPEAHPESHAKEPSEVKKPATPEAKPEPEHEKPAARPEEKSDDHER